LEDFRTLHAHCKQKKIQFFSTPFDIDSIDFLNDFEMEFWKIPSGEVTNLPYLTHLAKTRKPVLMSTGMCTLEEIEQAVDCLRNYGSGPIKLLHCNTEYPTPFEDVNLKAIQTMKEHFNLEVGYSDHTMGIEIPIAAVAMGATIIEKHFTMDRNMKGPDHKASLEPDELKAMVAAVRHLEVAIGTGEKKVTPSETKNRVVARKSFIAKTQIKKGEIFSEENLTTKRPGTGVSPMKWFQVMGTAAMRDFEEDELIEI